MRILITGGAGFIGSHLCERLISEGHTVTVMDDFSTGRAQNLAQLEGNEGFTLIEGTILDTQLLNTLVSDSDYIFHLAAAVGVFNIVNNPLASLLTNIRGTENVLEAAVQRNIPVFVQLPCAGLIARQRQSMSHLLMLTLLRKS
jgi:UDP-glucose 4-epimerase